MKPLFRFSLLFAAWFYAASALAMSVAFVNPGKSDEKFWVSVSRFMQAAADDLGIQLEVLYAERDPAKTIDLARQIAARPQRPDYLVTVNEKLVAGEILQLTAASGIKVFLINNNLSPEQEAALGKPRQRLPHWIGSLVPNNEDAGYRMAEQLIEAGKRQFPKQAKLEMFALGGDRATAAGIEREAGLHRALQAHPEISLRQLTYGEWSRARGREQAEVLFQRYPEARLIWAANDQMAFGAMDAAVQRKLEPGKDVLLSGLNNSLEAMEARASGRLAALASGHFTTGGWAMVMLYDYHHGKDFAQVGPLERTEPLFMMLDAGQAKRFVELFGESRFEPIDFRSFSRVHNPKLKDYRFSLQPLLK
ncbi:MAG TPA: ABC transporter substrate-binding protein [Rhodocyclaceae bacterium]